MKPEQRKVALAFVKEAKRQGATYKQTKALLEAGLVESNLRNLNYGDRDSIGSLQQRNSWGSRQARLDPTQSARKFLQRAKSAKGGTSGQLAQAVQVSAFPDRYDQRGRDAAAILKQLGGGPAGVGGGTSPGTGRPDPAALLAFLQAPNNPDALLGLAQSMQGSGQASSGPSRATQAPFKGTGTGKGITGTGKGVFELFYDPLGGIKNGHQIGAIGGHSDHVHVAAPKPLLKKYEGLAKRMGLKITSTTGGKHVANSFHYKDEAADVAGDPKLMARFYKAVARG